MFDSTSFAKYEVVGPDAEAALSWICANDIRKPVGTITYTQMLNQRGGIECDLTVARIAEDGFYVVTGTGYRSHDAHWIQRGFGVDRDVRLEDVTEQHAVIGIMGPRSREVLCAVTGADLASGAFPFMTWQRLELAGVRLRAMRLTFVGELGWELHVPADGAVRVYDALVAAGRPFGMQNAGYRAIDSLRLEKGYRIWGKDISPDYTPLEAGLGFAVKLSTDVPFCGREALEAQVLCLQKRLAFFTVDDPDVVLLGRETILRNGERVGFLSSGGFGYTVGKPIGLGYVCNPAGVDRALLSSGDYELEVSGTLWPCTLHMQPLYDPKSERVRA